MLKETARAVFEKLGYTMSRSIPVDVDMERDFLRLYRQCRPYTMTSMERMYGLYKALRYVAAFPVPGDVVECGVWRGGSAMLCAMVLKELAQTHRKLYLYDTFEGMPEPGDKDVRFTGESARVRWERLSGNWDRASLDEVTENMASTGYPTENVVLVRGKVEETIPKVAPGSISLLRLDTDWFESTYHELVHLFPRVSPHGVLIVDDYGHWLGAREAVDKYWAECGIKLLLHRIDFSGRLAVKCCCPPDRDDN